jgi:hypothetical protein
MIEVDHPNKCNTATPPRPTVFYLIFIFFSISHANLKLADFKLQAQ